MFDRAIVASELSSVAFDVLKRLKGLKSLGVKECLLLQCVNPHEINAVTAPFINSILAETLEKQKALLISQGYVVQTRVVRGLMKNEINRIAVEEHFSLIIAGSAEHSQLGESYWAALPTK
jgi:nucleotide-binding universal stress UspA family protein